jgi:flavin reductase (DIM6/NTAB) family NADH-FMN oxidoreductase RutF
MSLTKSSRTHDLILSAGCFGITILSNDQHNISELFAGQTTESEDRFKGIELLTLATGAPVIKGGLAFVGVSGKPIVYYDQQYHQLQD